MSSKFDLSKSRIVANAIEGLLELNEWQTAEIKAGLKEANAGRLVEHEEVKKKRLDKL